MPTFPHVAGNGVRRARKRPWAALGRGALLFPGAVGALTDRRDELMRGGGRFAGQFPMSLARPQANPATGGQETLARRMTRDPRLRMIVVGLLAVGGAMLPVLGYALRPEVGPRAVVAGVTTLIVAGAVAAAPIRRMSDRWFEALPILVVLTLALTLAAFRPDGVVVMPAVTFLAATIAFVIDRPRHRAVHACIALVAVFGVLAAGPTSTLTWVAAACALQCTMGLGLLVWLFWRPAEQQAITLENLARRDPLTGVGNRRLLDERLADEISRSRRTGTPFSLVVLDLNGFKEVNDSLGHAAGDDVLRRVSDALVAVSRRHEVVTRPGGDEFCVIAPGVDVGQTTQLLARLREAVARAGSGGAEVTTAAGVATFPVDAVSADHLFEVADARQRDDKQSRHSADRRGRPLAAAGTASGRAARLVFAHAEPESPSLQAARRRSTRWGVAAVLAWCAVGAIPVAVALDAPRLSWVSALLVVMSGMTLLLPTGRLDARWFQGLPLFLAAPIALAVFVAGDDGMTLLAAVVFVAAAVAFIADRTAVMAGQLGLTSVVIAGAALAGSPTREALLTVACALPVMWGVALVQRLPWLVAAEQAVLLHDLARRDPLTGAGNRLLLDERLGAEIARHHATGRCLSVFVLDLDGFKAINDVAGHAAGDAALRDVADALQRCVRPQDTVVRQGGDEFCVIAPEATAGDAAVLGVRLGTAIAAVAAAGRQLGGAVGHATYPGDGSDPEALLGVADQRQRAAKGQRPDGAAGGRSGPRR